MGILDRAVKDLRDLGGKGIVVIDGGDWMRYGAIWTPDNVGYSFAFREHDNCIGLLSLDVWNKDLASVWRHDGIYLLRKKHDEGLIFCSNGMNPRSNDSNPYPYYERISDHLTWIVESRRAENLVD